MVIVDPYIDTLGQSWPREKLDRLLGDPTVMRLVEVAIQAGYASDRSEWYPARTLSWARARYRREESAGLLCVLALRFRAIGLDPFNAGGFAE
ncbi:hypothetical protein ASF53_05090 [Methylobacterium sp. Leaf123]|uniref:hypothetical protein n=1 Tax=Methylobacterium sp. Leaf123 TaxID=1736264 RepID=UPI0006F8DED7|nr:hypothetical protein [Methylobacterium sp. Leaf123]KQQ23703.1 hypothetical protein ASF53_05090 [Methylobacterium sp. Leaf123]